MNTGQWQAAWRIFNAARELPAEEQRRFVESQSADPEIAQRVFDELEALRDEDAAGGDPPLRESTARAPWWGAIGWQSCLAAAEWARFMPPTTRSFPAW